jgi:hypothetical protein
MIVEQLVKLVDVIAWPIVVVLTFVVFYPQLSRLFRAILLRIESGAELKTPWASLGKAPSAVEAPKESEPITENHMALVHSSWRYPKKDKEFGRPMYSFHAIIQAPDEVLDRIEFVKYKLHPSYPNPIQPVNDRKSHFKLKELAWGESILGAEVKIKDQDEPIHLSRYINLTETGPRIP